MKNNKGGVGGLLTFFLGKVELIREGGGGLFESKSLIEDSKPIKYNCKKSFSFNYIG